LADKKIREWMTQAGTKSHPEQKLKIRSHRFKNPIECETHLIIVKICSQIELYDKETNRQIQSVYTKIFRLQKPCPTTENANPLSGLPELSNC